MARFEIVEVEATPIVFVSRTSRMAPEAIGATMGEAFGALAAFICGRKITPAGPPLAHYHGYDEKEIRFDVGFPIVPADREKVEGEVKAGETPAGRALKTVHTGPYAQLKETYNEIMKHMEAEGLSPAGYSWEVYVTDPDKTPEDRLVTEIYFPLP